MLTDETRVEPSTMVRAFQHTPEADEVLWRRRCALCRRTEVSRYGWSGGVVAVLAFVG
jgi:hypothetical protein